MDKKKENKRKEEKKKREKGWSDHTRLGARCTKTMLQ